MPITISKSSAAKAAWHRQLHASNLGAQFEEGRLTVFPRSQLDLTTEYINRKKARSRPEEANKLLHDLILEHVNVHNGNHEVATLACLLEFSAFEAVSALTNFRGESQQGSISTYLRLLIAAHSIQPNYVSEHEAQVAIALLRIRMQQPEPLMIFRSLISSLAKIRTSSVLPVSYINGLLTFFRIPESYRLYIEKLASRNQFASLYRAMSWIKGIVADPEQYRLAYEVIQAQVSDLNMWYTWQPDEAMLQRWEDYNFKPEHVVDIQPIFRLECPDSTGVGYHTFKEAGAACFQTINLSPPNLHGIQCLYVLLLQAMDSGDGAIDVMCRLCLRAPATPESIKLANDIITMRNESCYRASMLIIAELTPSATHISRALALTSALPVLQQYPAMRQIFASRVIDIVVPSMLAIQEAFRMGLKRTTNRDTMGSVIMGYARAIKFATWLNDLVAWPEDFRSKLDRMPSEKVHRDVMQHLERPHSDRVDVVLKDYLAATIGGTGTEEEIAYLKASLDAEQEFFLSHFEVERDRILGAIKKLNYVTDINFLRACKNQILKEDLVLLKDMLPLVERGTSMSCIDMLRILARRIELPMAVSEVWLSLVLLIMSSHNTKFLNWACDNLPVAEWFRFITDIRIVFQMNPGQLDALAKVGLTAERLNWWERLHAYRSGVEDLDRRWREKNGGLGSMRWLYLQEVPNVNELLDVTVGHKQLGYDKQWLLSFFEPSQESLTTLCNCIAAHNSSSPEALYGVRSVLERFYNANSWPESASQAYLLAWTQSKSLTDEDKRTFSLLSELMQIKPSMNPHGLAFIKNNMLKEYDNVIELARNVEAIRIQLSRQDKARTTELAQSLGMEGMRAYVDPDIPEDLADAIECVGYKEYELCFPLSHIKGHDRKVRGIGSDLFPILTVRVSMAGTEQENGFCVHLSPHETVHDPVKGLQLVRSSESESPPVHNYWRPHARGKPKSRICFVSFNLFTYTLSQRLQRHFTDDRLPRKPVTLKSIHDIVNDTIARPGSECTSCGDPLTSLWKPTVCSKPSCSIDLSQSSLLVQAYGLLVDGPVLDFLLGCVYSAARDTSGLPLLGSDCPYDKTKMCTVLDTFPAMPADENMTPFDLLNKIRTASPSYTREREQILGWMSKWFRGCMLSAPPGKRLSIMSDVEQFLLYNSTPECEKAFYDTVQASASSSSSNTRPAAKTGDVVFHGSPPARMWKVLTEGLRNMSNTRYMAHGAVNGPGIYLANEPVTSFNYSGNFNNTWFRSAYKGKKILMGCELLEQNPNAPLPAGAKKPPVGTHIVTDESRVLVRYVFICPPTYAMPVARNIDMAMRTTFRSLRAGPNA